MPTVQEIKDEILKSLVIKEEAMMSRIHAELAEMEDTDGMKEKNNLVDFYERWQRRKGQIGKENKVNSFTAYALGMASKRPEDGSEFMPARRTFVRPGPPDVDFDIDATRRAEVYEHVINKFGGPEYVANTGTYQNLKFRAAVTRTVKALDLANAFHKGNEAFTTENANKVKEILDNVPNGMGGYFFVRPEGGGKPEKVKESLENALKLFPDFAYYAKEKYPDLGKMAAKIEGLYSAASSHPAGLVVSPIPLKEIAPLMRVKNGSYATQYVYEELEKLGLVKFDFLALKTITIVAECLRLIESRYGIKIDIEKIPWDDQKTFELYRSGKLTGVFQCAGKGMQDKMVEIGVDSLKDIVAIIALYRPGPMDSIPRYAARKKGLEKIEYPHPRIAELAGKHLKDTYGILVYQEQIMLILESMAGFTKTQGLMVIKAVGKKLIDLLKKYKVRFLRGCVKNGIPERICDDYWERVIMPFAGYGFNYCLSGDMRIKNEKDGAIYTVRDMEKMAREGVLDAKASSYSYKENKMVDDEIVDVFCTGEKEVFEIEMSNGVKNETTMDHKFLCFDKKMRAVKEIVEGDCDIICDDWVTKITSVKSLGVQKTYNLTMKSEQHNYKVLPPEGKGDVGLISANSHSASYADLSYLTGLLKINYTEEFLCANLNIESQFKKFDKVEIFERDLRNFNIKLLPRTINESTQDYQIVRKADQKNGITNSEIRASLMVKGVGYESAIEIAKHRPYKDLRDLAAKTNSSLVNLEVIGALFEGGLFNDFVKQYNALNKKKGKMNKEEFTELFHSIREDQKKNASRGVESGNIWDDEN